MEKILTVVVPAYNVEEYLGDTLQSFVEQEILQDIEVLVINDGSKDRTPEIARKYEEAYPETFRLISKENGGHGSTINCGIKEAKGVYFKVVDGDDWVETKAFAEMVKRLWNASADYVVTNFYRVNNVTKERKAIEFPLLKPYSCCSFDEVAQLPELPMHALAIRTAILQENQIRLDEHSFYVDNEYISFPIPYVETVEYYDLTVYMYRVAQMTQSISVKGFQRHLADHVKVTLRLVDFAAEYGNTGKDPQKAEYLNNLAAIMVGNQAGIYATFPASDRKIKSQFEKFDETVKEKSQKIYALSDKKSKMLHGLRRSHFKYYWFWTTMSKLRARFRKS